MIPDTTSFPAYVRSLRIASPVTTKPGRMVAGPPRPILELALRLGLGALIFDTPHNRSILEHLGIAADLARAVGRRLRSLAQWRSVWAAFALPHLRALDEADHVNDVDAAREAIRSALVMLDLAYGGDGHYVHTTMPIRRAIRPQMLRLYARRHALSGARVERVEVPHSRGNTTAVLQFPDEGAPASPTGRVPVLVALHPLSNNKDRFDYDLTLFRAAGYATLCVDLPAHGDNFDGPRLRPDDEAVGVGAVEAARSHPDLDAERVGVLGASLGGYYALRTAAASASVKACLAYCAGFDLGKGLEDSVRGIVDNFGYVIGARTRRETLAQAKPFHLRAVLAQVRCPVALVHGTQDHIVDFSASYEIARRLPAPPEVYPLAGVDHEAAHPSTPRLASPGIEWLRRHL